MGQWARSRDVDWDEWVQAININLMGTVYPCRAIAPHFRANKYGKIVNLSGGGATIRCRAFPHTRLRKRRWCVLTETLALELKEANVDVNAVAPGRA